MPEPDKRVRSVAELPTESLNCASAGRHLGFWTNPPTVKRITGWGPLDSREVTYSCNCGRWKKEILDWDTKETLSRGAQYGGGVLLEIAEQGAAGGLNTREAKAEWLTRCERAAKTTA